MMMVLTVNVDLGLDISSCRTQIIVSLTSSADTKNVYFDMAAGKKYILVYKIAFGT